MSNKKRKIETEKKLKKKDEIEYDHRIKELIGSDLKWQDYYDRIQKVAEVIKIIKPVFFDFGEAGFCYKMNNNTELIFHLRSDDSILEYYLVYKGESDRYGKSSYTKNIDGDIKFIKEIIDLFNLIE